MTRQQGSRESAIETLKRRLAQEHPLDREAYTEGKGRFIERITAIAIGTDNETGESQGTAA